jgi:hypothetical protein
MRVTKLKDFHFPDATSEELSASAWNAWNAKQWSSQAQRVELEELWHLKLRSEVCTLNLL